MDTLISTGQPAPDFELLDLYGISHSLQEFTGRVVVVNFWSAECPHSARADLELVEYLKDWEERVVLLPVASNANEPLELLRQVTIPALLANETRQPEQEGAQGSHEASPDGERNRAMMPAVRSHSRASFLSCFLPARVRV